MKCKCGHNEDIHVILKEGDTDLACMTREGIAYCECMKFEADEAEVLAALRNQLAEARKVIEPFVFANATNNEKRLLYNQLEERKAAAAYLAKYKETCSCKLPGFAVADPDTCPTCGKPHRAA